MFERLKQLENNIAELEKLKKNYQEEDIRNDTAKEWALRYGLLESIQIVIDISCHLAVHNNLGNPQTSAECIELLEEFDYVEEDLKEVLTKMVGLRNILVHEYVKVDVRRLYNLLNKLDDFETFITSLRDN